ncbi:MAG TPA: Yip1 family protein [Steroidobacteraceae bacterium]
MAANNLIDRAKSILLTPRTEWPAIAAEPDTVGGIYTRYIIIMAAIPAVVQFISAALIGISVPFLGYYRVGIGPALGGAVLAYLLTLVAVFIVAVIVDVLAPTFGGEKNQVQALKVVAYSYTASWVISIAGLVPGLKLIAALVGLVYGIYLLNMGLPFTMKCPPEKSVGYTAVTIIVAIVVGFVLSLILRAAGGWGLGYNPVPSSTFSAPSGVGSGEGFAPGSAGAGLQAWSKRVDAASKQIDAAQKSGDSAAQANAVGAMLGAALGNDAKVEALAPDRLKPLVPDSLEGLKRTQLSVDRSAAMGMQISKAQATYSDGADHAINLEIVDSGSLKGLVGFANGWAGVEQDHETDTGYDKTYKSGGQLVHEEWNNQNHNGEYAVIVVERFSVKVSGKAANVDELKAALAGVNLGALAALKNEGVQSK